MNGRLRRLLGTAALLALGATMALGCDTGDAPLATDPAADELPEVVQPGKEDNFLANTAQEYTFEGTATVTLESRYANASDEERMARVRDLIRYKQVVIGWFLNAYLVEKSHDDANATYGGFKGLTKNGSYEDLDITPEADGLTFSFRFRHEAGGQMNLMRSMGLTPGPDGSATFDLIVGKISNSEMARLDTDAEWYRSAPWSAFDPTKVDEARLERLPLTLRPQPRSDDAWIDLPRLIDDGLLTVGVHYGWDYHGDYHIVHARELFSWLRSRGFTAPVATFDDLTPTSAPFVRTAKAFGREIRIEVYLYTGRPGTPTDPDTSAGGQLLEDLMRTSFAERDVIVFSGHSGPFYGFALANWRTTSAGDLDDSEIPGLDMPPDRYQVVMAEGCDTYALGQAFWQNPAKANRLNLDVITTTSYSNASTAAAVKDFLTAIFGTDASDRFVGSRYLELLKRLDSNSRFFTTMYGVHGIDDNPRMHPLADPAALCQACTNDAACGSGVGMKCVRLAGGPAVCTAECTADAGCPDGYACRAVAERGAITFRGCVPANAKMSCAELQAALPKAEARKLVINEVLVAPAAGPAGDANGDGATDAVADEFIEIVNIGRETANLAGWTVSDGAGVRFTFPAGTTVAPGRGVVVFGGGDPAAFTWPSAAQVVVAARGLGLTNEGDSAILADERGEAIDQVLWGPEGAMGVSLVRVPERDPAAPLKPNAVADHTAGFDQEGESY